MCSVATLIFALTPDPPPPHAIENLYENTVECPKIFIDDNQFIFIYNICMYIWGFAFVYFITCLLFQ